MEKDFKKLLMNNEKEDWNNLTFRETMMSAYYYCALEYIKKANKELFDDILRFSEIKDGFRVIESDILHKIKKKHNIK